MPDFLARLVGNHPGRVPAVAAGGILAKKIADTAPNILRNKDLGNLAISCLSLDPEMRPCMEDISAQLVRPTYEFHFMDYLSREFKEEVLRFVIIILLNP